MECSAAYVSQASGCMTSGIIAPGLLSLPHLLPHNDSLLYMYTDQRELFSRGSFRLLDRCYV